MEVIYKDRKYKTGKGRKYLTCGSSRYIYSRYLHRQIWFDNYGKIPDGYSVHHKDENRFNNDISNLEILTHVDHCKLHMAKRVKENPEQFKKLAKIGREYAKEWHKTKEGNEWHIKQAKKYNFGNFIYGDRECDYCGKKYIQRQAVSKFCCNNCKAAFRRESGVDNVEAKCYTCKQKFIKNKYQSVKYCSKCKRW